MTDISDLTGDFTTPGGNSTDSSMKWKNIDGEKKRKKYISKRKRDENRENCGKKLKPTPTADPTPTTIPPTLKKDDNVTRVTVSSETRADVIKDDETINSLKTAKRVRQIRKKTPLLNEAQVVRAVKAALNEQPIIILPIFLTKEA